MKANVPMLRQLAERMRNLPDEAMYRQEVYAMSAPCGTACCIAGHAVILAGYRLVRGETGEFVCEKEAGELLDIHDVAVELLGLSQWCDLFDGDPEVDWPEPFAGRWEHALEFGGERPSRIAADYLDHLANEAEAVSCTTPQRREGRVR